VQLNTGKKALLQTMAKRYAKPLGPMYLALRKTNGIGWKELRK